jgi:ABC-2 type transport system permease protein
MFPSLAFRTLLAKEIRRFLNVWLQTIFTPVITTGLYLVIFGVSLGKQINLGTGVSYLAFIVPGLIMMGIVNNAAQNTSSSIFISKLNNALVDILVAPLSAIETAVAYTLGGVTRALLVGFITWVISWPFELILPQHPFFVVVIALATATFFSALGALVAIFADKFDHIGAFNTFILLPLIYLGGVFYSIHVLPPFWQNVSRANPIFYMIDGFRYGFLGRADGSPFISLGIVCVFAVFMLGLLSWVLKKGYRLRT